jgi:hypothetical protein
MATSALAVEKRYPIIQHCSGGVVALWTDASRMFLVE